MIKAFCEDGKNSAELTHYNRWNIMDLDTRFVGVFSPTCADLAMQLNLRQPMTWSNP